MKKIATGLIRSLSAPGRMAVPWIRNFGSVQRRPPRIRDPDFFKGFYGDGADDDVNKELRNTKLQEKFQNNEIGNAESEFLKCSRPSVATYSFLIDNFLDRNEILLGVHYIEELANNFMVDKMELERLLVKARKTSVEKGPFSRMDKIKQIAAANDIWKDPPKSDENKH